MVLAGGPGRGKSGREAGKNREERLGQGWKGGRSDCVDVVGECLLSFFDSFDCC